MTVHTDARSAKPDLIIATAIFVISAGALALSFTYPPAVSMLLPRLAAGLGIFCAGWLIISKTLALRAAPRDDEAHRVVARRSAQEETSGIDLPVAEDVDGNDPEYVLSHTPRKIWAVTLGFIAGFFLVLYLAGIFVAAAALSFLYLFVVGKKTWLYSLVYTVVLTGLLWALMRWVTYIPSPTGILFHGG